MLSYSQAYYNSIAFLEPIYDRREASAISHEILLHITGLNKMQRLMQKDDMLTQLQQEQYERMLNDLKTGRPLQYVTGEAWFMSRLFKVNEKVLIPRPETEELVEWIISDYKDRQALSIIDIGTGSGCIPISLKLSMADAEVTSCDVSTGALEIARINAESLKVGITLQQLDFLEAGTWNSLGTYDIIVSNPPYIPLSEMANMHSNVKEFEPDIALFVPDEDALLFYRCIADFGLIHLAKNGAIYCELHYDRAEQAQLLFKEKGYTNVDVRKDMHGNYRMLRALK